MQCSAVRNYRRLDQKIGVSAELISSHVSDAIRIRLLNDSSRVQPNLRFTLLRWRCFLEAIPVEALARALDPVN